MIAIPFPWKLAIGAIVVTMTVGSVWWAFNEGRSAARTESLEKGIATQRRITDADAHGPRTPDDVERRLRDGSF
jgi:hypothetical protein